MVDDDSVPSGAVGAIVKSENVERSSVSRRFSCKLVREGNMEIAFEVLLPMVTRRVEGREQRLGMGLSAFRVGGYPFIGLTAQPITGYL